MPDKLYFYKSLSYDPYHNLAVEEYILKNIGEGECVLYIYQNKNAVIIGKHQNPWVECNLMLLKSEGGLIARRISGGGAVCHGKGNLNYSFIMDKNAYDEQKQFSVVLNALKALGVNALVSGKSNITVNGKKISGNAFCFKKQGALHHGTLLINADLSKLTRYLALSNENIISKGIASIPAQVINLKDINYKITVEKAVNAVKASFENEYGGTDKYLLSKEAKPLIDILRQKNASEDFIYGETPKFEVVLEPVFDWGKAVIRFKTENARITHTDIQYGSFAGSTTESIEKSLLDCKFNSAAVYERLANLKIPEKEKQVISDIADYLLNKGF